MCAPLGEWAAKAVASYIDIDSNKKHFAKTNKHTMRADGYPGLAWPVKWRPVRSKMATAAAAAGRMPINKTLPGLYFGFLLCVLLSLPLSTA